MAINIGGGVQIGGGIAIDRDNVSLVSDGLTLHLDAGNINSYSGSGSTWTDLAGGDNNITLVNSPTYTSATPAYFTFNGSTQYGTGSGTGVCPSTAYTKSVWFRLNAYQDNNLVSGSSGGHFMFFGGATSTLYAGHANVTPYTQFGSVATISLNTWYYAAVTFSTSEGIKLYINDTLDNANAGFVTAHTGNGSTNLACFGAGGNLLNGRIGQVFCYNRVLTANEIFQNFNSTRNRYGI